MEWRRPAPILIEVVILIILSVASEGRVIDLVRATASAAELVPATVTNAELLGFAICQYEFCQTLCWFTLYVWKGRHSHAAFLNFSNDRILVSRCGI